MFTDGKSGGSVQGPRRERKRDTIARKQEKGERERERERERESVRGPNTKDLDRQVVIYCLATDSSVVSLSLN